MSPNAVSTHLLNTPRDGDSVISLGIGKLFGNSPFHFLEFEKLCSILALHYFILILSGSSLYRLKFKILQSWMLCCLNLQIHPVFVQHSSFSSKERLIWKDNLLV